MDKDPRLAVLIDADNVSHTNVSRMLQELTKYGTPTFKRIYADWTKPTLSGWKNVLLKNAITPIQQYSYTSGKNSSDSALIIDAMDILYSGRVDGFCIISSDSDFTRLATRLREAGMKVIGMGEKKTPEPFISACDKFIYLEILKQQEQEEEETLHITNDKKQPSKPNNKKEEPAFKTLNNHMIKMIVQSVDDLADEDGWAYLADLGNMILKKQPDFDARNYGFAKLLALIKSTKRFDIDQRNSGKKNTTEVYVKVK